MAKPKKQYPEDFKTMFGVTVMGGTFYFGYILISAYLMIYITDYSGIYTGIAGKAAAVATLMLLIGRIWDGVNDPIFGFIMDRSPRTKWGRFKPFMFIFTPVSALLLIGLFSIPAGVSDIAKIALLYILYFLFDSAFTLLPITPLTQSLSNDTRVRSKLLGAPRIFSLVLSMLVSAFIAVAIALGPDGKTPNMGLGAVVFLVPLTILSVVGVALVKEGKNNADEEQVKIKDILAMAKANKPLWISLLVSLVGGFSWTFVNTAIYYYIKYAFGAEKLGTNSVIVGMMMLLSSLLGVFVVQGVMKIKGVTPAIAWIISYALSVVPLAILWIINLAGPITNMALFFLLIFLPLLGVGMSWMPQNLIMMECMDFNKDKVGKSMEGTVAAVNTFVMKLQAAVASAVTGAILVAIGYNAELYKNATTIPASLFSGLGIVMFALPALVSLIALGLLFFYPLRTKSQHDAMYAEIEKRKLEKAALTPSAGSTN